MSHLLSITDGYLEINSFKKKKTKKSKKKKKPLQYLLMFLSELEK